MALAFDSEIEDVTGDCRECRNSRRVIISVHACFGDSRTCYRLCPIPDEIPCPFCT